MSRSRCERCGEVVPNPHNCGGTWRQLDESDGWHELGTTLEGVGRVVPTIARLAGGSSEGPAVDVGQILLAVVLLVHGRNGVALGRLAEHARRLAP